MSAKSRGGWNLGMCLKDCSHKGVDEVCGACIRFSNFNNMNPERTEELSVSYSHEISGHKEDLSFHPHYNRSLGKYIATKGEYLSELKKGNFIPTPKNMREAPPRKEYKLNADTHKVMRAIREQSTKDGQLRPSGTLAKELIRRNVMIKQDKLQRFKQYTGN